MNKGENNVTTANRTTPSTLRPRVHRLISFTDDETDGDAVPSTAIGRSKPDGSHKAISSQSDTSAPATAVGSTSDLWSTWSSYASSLLSGSPATPGRAKADKSVPRSPNWSDQGSSKVATAAQGSLEERRAMIQAERRKALLAASAETPDSRGNYKRRDSMSQAASDDGDGQAQVLAYRHLIRPDDTLAGVMLKYGCQADVFRKVNRLWPNDRIQTRTEVLLPVDACSVRGKRVDGPADADGAVDGAATSPCRSSVIADDEALSHESWVLLPNCSKPVEMVRMPRTSLGYFPRPRRKSNSTGSSLVSSPAAHKTSFDKLRHPPTHAAQVTMSLNASPIRRARQLRQPSGSRGRSSSTATPSFGDALRGPGGVGTLRGLRTEPSRPGPADDALNQTFRQLFPDLDLLPAQDLPPPRLGGPGLATPRLSSDSVRSLRSNSSGLGDAGGALEGWMRKLAGKKDRGAGPKMGDLIELETNNEHGELGEENLRTPTSTKPNLSRLDPANTDSQWNTKNLGWRLGADAASAVTASALIAPVICVIDRSVVTKVATGDALSTCLSQAIRPALRHPIRFLASRPFLLIFSLYLTTYTTANTIDTLTSVVKNQPADRVNANMTKFVATSSVNMALCVYKDTHFNVPTLLAPTLAKLPPAIQTRFKPLLATEASRISTAQFVAPAVMQIFSTPIHLLGLDVYNRQTRLGLRARLARVVRDWGVSALARMCRIIPAFGFGAILYLATIFPATLMPMSVYAVSRGLAAVLFSPLLGRFIDRADRLRVVERSRGGDGSNSSSPGTVHEALLRQVNSQMRRIDLACKLLGPFLISVFDSVSTLLAIEVNFGLNVLSIAVEYVMILKDAVLFSVQELVFYVHHPAFRPSFAGSLLYLTVLSFSGQMITFLLASGLTSLHVAIARTLSVILELSATWLAPLVMAHIGPLRSAIWFLNWQLVIVQEEVEPDHRGAFSSVEAAFHSAFELLSYACTVYFSKPAQFRWPTL
ncbi:hypothetical protein DV735_g3464, partial [Chaetothyriales sp. CBS 134920]